ncbi:Ornithine carbamoyltransferase [hydrothermal vent metagenome]|uniref:ornithine carbamoyltransferase n=1 Tax=hydrothermal vent metagenome TaxID=652676 RepID=A0A3B0ZVH4_9ZZZZ
MTVKHFLTLLDLNKDEAQKLITRAIELKKMHLAGDIYEPLKNKVLAMIFDKSSTRTRISFEAGMAQFGGHAIFLSPKDTQLGRGEPIEDSARVMSNMVDAVMIRTFDHETVTLFAKHSSIPVINGLTDLVHPCQLLADIQTFVEHRGSIEGKTVAYIGDGNNMCHSYMNAAKLFNFKLRVATPKNYEPNNTIVKNVADYVYLSNDPKDAIKDADLVVTDVWASMGQESELQQRVKDFEGYCVNKELMRLANNNALFMHCLPAHRGEEVSAEIMDDPNSVVWDEAGNRLHAQKALLEFLMT